MDSLTVLIEFIVDSVRELIEGGTSYRDQLLY